MHHTTQTRFFTVADYAPRMLRVHLRAVVAFAVAAAVFMSAAYALAGDLAQRVTADEPVAPAGEAAYITQGHVDLGGIIVDGAQEFLARDDTAPEPVWRQPQDTILVLGDNALQTLPEQGGFDFVGAKPGQQVWVVPQTEIAGVPWLGWNTQSPTLLDVVDRNVEISFLGHTGPGEFALFLQNGGFEAPEVLVSTVKPEKDSFHVDLNTHTHANWTFTEPGIHQVGLKMTAPRKDGGTFEGTAIVTFAVGQNTDPAQAIGMGWNEAAADKGAAQTPWLWIAIGVGVLLVLLLAGIGLRRRGQAGAHNER